MAEAKKPRKKTPPDVETAALAKSARRCTLCFHLAGDLSEKHGQIAHLDDDRTNSVEDNLAWMCLEHHSLYDSTTSQHKNYTVGEVKGARAKLYDLGASGKHLEPAAPRPDSQIETARLQLQYQERQLKKEFFDQRYAIFVKVRDFISYALRENGRIQLAGPGDYREFWEAMERARMLFDADVNEYLADVDETARMFYVSAQGIDRAISTGDVDSIRKNNELMLRLSVTLLQQREAVFRPYLAVGQP